MAFQGASGKAPAAFMVKRGGCSRRSALRCRALKEGFCRGGNKPGRPFAPAAVGQRAQGQRAPLPGVRVRQSVWKPGNASPMGCLEHSLFLAQCRANPCTVMHRPRVAIGGLALTRDRSLIKPGQRQGPAGVGRRRTSGIGHFPAAQMPGTEHRDGLAKGSVVVFLRASGRAVSELDAEVIQPSAGCQMGVQVSGAAFRLHLAWRRMVKRSIWQQAVICSCNYPAWSPCKSAARGRGNPGSANPARPQRPRPWRPGNRRSATTPAADTPRACWPRPAPSR